MSENVPYVPFVDNAAAADEEFDDQELIDEIDAEEATAAAAAAAAAATAAAPPTVPLSVGAVETDVTPERRRFLSLMKSLSPSPVEKKLVQGINPRTKEGWRNWTRRRQGLLTYGREPTTSPAMMTKLLGRNNLARKLMVKLALNERDVPSTQNVRQIADRIEKRVDGPKVREAGLPPITMNELHAYASGTLFDPRRRYQPLAQNMPPQFPTVVQPLPPFTQASCLTTKKQLQQQHDELIKILKEKYAMLFNLQRIHFASIDQTNLDDASEMDAWYMKNCEQGMRPRNWQDNLEIAEQKSIEAITTLTEQCGQLRDRINVLREEITRRSRGKCSLLGGGKTKSKHTKSKKSKKSKKSNKSKRRN